jgi:hypothetical protein
VTYPDTGLTASTQYTYNVAAVGVGGTGAQSASVSATTQSSGSAGIRWAPGHFITLDYNISKANQLATIASLQGTAVKGVVIYFNWSEVDNPKLVGGVAQYDGSWGPFDINGQSQSGYPLVDRFLAACNAAGLLAIVAIFFQEYGNNIPNADGDGVLPKYLFALGSPGWYAWPGGAPWSGNLILVAGLDQTIIMNRYIALAQNHAARYANNPTYHMGWWGGETATAAPGFNQSGFNTNLLTMIPALRTAWPNTMLRLGANYVSPSTFFNQLFDLCVQQKFIVGGPDPELPLSRRAPPFDRGVTANEYYLGHSGTTNYQALGLPWIGEQEELGIAPGTTAVPADCAGFQMQYMHASYMVWVSFNTNGNFDLHSSIVPYIASVGGTVASPNKPAGW